MSLTLINSLVKYLFPPAPGESPDHPLELKALPGLTTLLDLALFRANEGQLTATTCSSHALLACWLDIKHQSQLLLNTLSYKESKNNNYNNNSTQNNNNKIALQTKRLRESFARQCLECSMDAIERLSTDKLASSANLSDPYESIQSGTGNANLGSGSHHPHHHHHHHGTTLLNGVGIQGIPNAVMESYQETGRRAPMQSRKDCWESPRLICPDHVWAEDAFTACHKWIRYLSKHPYVLHEAEKAAAAVTPPHDTTAVAASSGGRGKDSSSGGGGSASDKKGNKSSKASTALPQRLAVASQQQASILLQLIQEDLPLRLYQFRQAMEAESVVTKRLYLVKSEYRAPLRAFLEAHQTLFRAPSMELVDMYLQPQNKKNSNNNNNNNNQPPSSDEIEKQLEDLLNTPALIEMLAIEQECETLEVEMAKRIFPFSELARALEQKRARLQLVPGVLSNEYELTRLQETIRRLKCALCRNSGSEASSGIRPLLLDLQNVPRDDQLLLQGQITQSSNTVMLLENNIHDFVSQLECLSILVKTKNAFATYSSSKSNSNAISATSGHHDHHHGTINTSTTIDLSMSIVKGCTDNFDKELLQCQLMDWFELVQRQHELQAEHVDLSDRIRKAEMAMSIAGASEQSLRMVKERLEKMQTDRKQRLQVLKELLEDLCLREMSLFVQLTGPDPNETLVLHPTSAVGFLGIPLQIAGEWLPVG